MELSKISFRTSENDTGSLTFIEGMEDVPFEIKRIYYIHHVDSEARRGFHAHKSLEQYLICVSGSCKVLLDDGKEKVTVELNKANEGVYVGPMCWHEMYDFSSDMVLLVLASDRDDESDYIRNYNEFMALVEGRK